MKLNQDPNDKYSEYEVDFHAHEEEDANLDTHEAYESRHRDKVLDQICDTHPSAPMCKVFDD